jgi:hypothetical protein
MTTDTAPGGPPAERPDVESPEPDPAERASLLTGLGAAASLVFGAVLMLGFGAAWAYLFYPPRSLAVGGAAVCAAFALAGLVQAVREFARAVRWRPRP